jgi:hypothetical protein
MNFSDAQRKTAYFDSLGGNIFSDPEKNGHDFSTRNWLEISN